MKCFIKASDPKWRVVSNYSKLHNDQIYIIDYGKIAGSSIKNSWREAICMRCGLSTIKRTILEESFYSFFEARECIPIKFNTINFFLLEI